MKQEFWRNRISSRSDMVARVAHLTGRHSDSDEDAFELLWKIIVDKKLIASGNEAYIRGDQKAVCFQEVPLIAIAENLAFEIHQEGKQRYAGFGIRVNKGSLFKQGGRPVIYAEDLRIKGKILPDELWRAVNLNLDDPDNIIDWTHEREWRFPGDFEFEYQDIEVILKNSSFFKKFVERCLEKDRTDILTQIQGIITLDSVVS